MPATSSGSAALITRLETAVLKNCATKTFSATFFCSSIKLAGRSNELMALMIIFSMELTMVTATAATPTSTVSRDRETVEGVALLANFGDFLIREIVDGQVPGQR